MPKFSSHPTHRHAPLSTFEGAHKAVAAVLRAALKTGATIRRTGKGHFQVETANGAVHVSGTPRDPEAAAKRLRYQLRQKGMEIR